MIKENLQYIMYINMYNYNVNINQGKNKYMYMYYKQIWVSGIVLMFIIL